MNQRFKGRVVVITGGGGRNTGRSLALGFAREGAKVVLVGRSVEALQAVAEEVAGVGGECLIAAGNVAREDEVDGVFAAAVERFGTVDILINNAADNLRQDTVDTELADWDRVLGTNLTGPFLCSRAALRIMIAKGWGRIINISSTAGLSGLATRGAYCASKFGLLGLNESMAAEVQGTEININAVCPGNVTAVSDGSPAKTVPGEKHPNLLDLRPQPMVHPDEVAQITMFLASDEARAIRGQAIEISAGQTMREA